MCFTVQIPHNPATANTTSAMKNSAIKSATIWSTALKVNLCPKHYAVCFLHSSLTWNCLCNLTFPTGFLGMLCVSFLNFFADLTLIQFLFQCLKALFPVQVWRFKVEKNFKCLTLPQAPTKFNASFLFPAVGSLVQVTWYRCICQHSWEILITETLQWLHWNFQQKSVI